MSPTWTRIQNDYAYSSGKWGTPEWLNKSKMAELGFDVDKLTSTAEHGRRHQESLAREALLVLELNDKSYQQELQRAKAFAAQAKVALEKNADKEEFKEKAKMADKNLKDEEQTKSRLFAIDAGIDLPKLRARYPDRTRYAIIHGLIYPSINQGKNETTIGGNIREVHAENIHVPLTHRKIFEDTATPYEVSVAFGKRLEPWITEASKTVLVK